jgi:hypothetical protein
MILSLVFSPTVVRWFFSEKGNRKGYLWYFDMDNFIEVKNKFEWFQALHLLLVIFPLIGANAWVLYPIVPRLWYRYMVEMVSLCILHILIYAIAFLELWSAKDKITAADKIEKEKEREIKAKYGEKNSDQSLVHGLLDQNNPLIQSHNEIIVGNAAMIPNNSYIEQGKGNELRRSELEIMKPIQINGSPAKNPYLVNNPASTPNVKTKEQMMGIQKTTVDHQVVLPTRMDSFDPKSKLESPKKNYQDKLTPMNKAIRFAEVKLVPEKGVLRPKLEVVTKAQKNNFKDAGKNTNVGTENTKPIVKQDENNEKVFEYPSAKINLDESNIKAPEKSRFKENQLFSKWWFGNSTKKYLEIIYEEDESTAKINENPDYDEPDREAEYNQEFPKLGHLDAEKQELYTPKKANAAIKFDVPSNMNLEIKPKKEIDIFPEIEENESLVGNSRLINGQKEIDILSGQLKDRNGQELILDEQDEKAMQEGTYYDTQNRKVMLNTQNPSVFNKGLIKDIDGAFHRLRDQDLDLLSKGVTLKRSGSVDNINGQHPQDIDRQMLYDRDGRKLDLVKQSPDCFDRGVFKVDDKLMVPMSERQNPNKMMLGLITAPNGKDYRIKDQYFDEIATNQQYRDRNLRPIVGPQPSSSYFDKQQSLMDEQLRKIQELEKQPLLHNPVQNTSSYARNDSSDNYTHKDDARKEGLQSKKAKEPSIENLKKPSSVKSAKSIKPAMKQQSVRFDGQASRDSLYPIGYEPRESDGRRVTEEDEIDSVRKSSMNRNAKNGPKVQIKDFEYNEKPAEKRKAPIVSITEKSKNNRSSIRSEKPLQKPGEKGAKKSPTGKSSLKDYNPSKESLLREYESEDGEEEDAKRTEKGSINNLREEMEKAVEYEQEDSEGNEEYDQPKKPTVSYVSNHTNKPKPTLVERLPRTQSPVVAITQAANRQVPPLILNKPSESTVRDPRETGTIKEVPHSKQIAQPIPDSIDRYDVEDDEVLGANRETPTDFNNKDEWEEDSENNEPNPPPKVVVEDFNPSKPKASPKTVEPLKGSPNNKPSSVIPDPYSVQNLTPAVKLGKTDPNFPSESEYHPFESIKSNQKNPGLPKASQPQYQEHQWEEPISPIENKPQNTNKAARTKNSEHSKDPSTHSIQEELNNSQKVKAPDVMLQKPSKNLYEQPAKQPGYIKQNPEPNVQIANHYQNSKNQASGKNSLARETPEDRRSVASKKTNPSDRNQRIPKLQNAIDDDDNGTMYLEMMVDESFDMDLNIEEVEDGNSDEMSDPEIEVNGKRNLTQGEKYFPNSRLAKIADKNLKE